MRLSDEDKDKQNKLDNSEPIKNQRHLLLEEINKRKDFTLVGEYCDEDLSGAGTYRPEFERLIKDCENGLIDVVLCKSQSRFSRDMEIIEKYLHNKFIEWNIRFIGLSDNADTENKGNKKARQINGLVNEWYLEDVSNNIRSAFQAKMKQGEYISPFASFGYEISKENNNKLIIDKEAEIIVKQIFNLYLSGLGYTGIAKYLNNQNIPSPSLYKYQKKSKLNIISNRPREQIKWNANAIKRILTNELYIGNLVQGKRTTINYKNHKIKRKNHQEWIKIENTHDPIIDKETFIKVQRLIKERTKPNHKTNLIHIFSGKVFCLECNHYMRKKNSTKHEYLICSNNQNGYNDCSNKTSIRYDLLEKIILNEINKLIKKYYDIKILNNINLNNNKNNTNNILSSLIQKQEKITKEINKKDNYLKSLYEDKVNNLITKEQFIKLIDSYNNDITTLQNQLIIIKKEISRYQDKINSKNDNTIFNKYNSIDKLNKVIIDEFIKKIYIGKINTLNNTRDIKIIWNF